MFLACWRCLPCDQFVDEEAAAITVKLQNYMVIPVKLCDLYLYIIQL